MWKFFCGHFFLMVCFFLGFGGNVNVFFWKLLEPGKPVATLI